jgi:hypothetical protein
VRTRPGPFNFSVFLTLNERKSHETCHPLSKPVALSPKLQAEATHPHPANTEIERGVRSFAPLWREAENHDHSLAPGKTEFGS